MIKKIFMILFSLSILLGLFACDNDETYMYTINDIYESIEIGYAEDNQSNYVTQSITLPTTSTLDERAVISWFSLYQNIVSNEGIVIRGDNDQVVVLTYTIEYAGMTVYGNESVTVIGLNDTHVYIITFDSVGGSDIESVIANEGDAIVAPETPINEGYQFAGWFTTENYTRVFTFSTMPSGNLTLYAKWNYIDENVYVITFDSNGGSAVEVISNNGGVSINEPNEPIKDGYVFAGWYSDQEFTLNFTFNYMPYESVILYAKWVDEASYTGYYDGAAGLYGDQLESFLYEIIHDGFHGVNYRNVKDIYLARTDVDPNNSNNIILIYTGLSVSKTWDSGNTYNTEHVWPQSLLEQEASNYTVNSASDLHHLRPANPSENSSRSNKWFGNSTTPTSYEPRDEVKGDIARMLFYMDIMYDELTLINLEVGEKPSQLEMGDLASLLLWNVLDPVDSFEMNRNNIIYSIQGNRNPFIDHPEFVDYIYN